MKGTKKVQNEGFKKIAKLRIPYFIGNSQFFAKISTHPLTVLIMCVILSL